MSPKVSDEHKEQRRRQILEAAERVFIRKGYEPATLKDIVEEADMSRGWIYLYFQTKEEIFEALLRKLDEDNASELSGQLSGASTLTEALEASLEQHKQDLLQGKPAVAPAIYEFLVTGWRNEERRSLFARRYDESIARLSELLASGTASGEFRPQLPLELIAKLISSHLDGIMMHALAVGPERVDSSAQIDALIVHVKQLLGVRADRNHTPAQGRQ
jgi:AcrR family transcriptional regulator